MKETNENFSTNLDERFKSSCFHLYNWPLSQVLLKNNELFPWLILVPNRANISEITELTKIERIQLMEEIYHASCILQNLYNPDKINTGALGNIVKQLHIHVVARFKNDQAWPHSIWQAQTKEQEYLNVDTIKKKIIRELGKIVFTPPGLKQN